MEFPDVIERALVHYRDWVVSHGMVVSREELEWQESEAREAERAIAWLSSQSVIRQDAFATLIEQNRDVILSRAEEYVRETERHGMYEPDDWFTLELAAGKVVDVNVFAADLVGGSELETLVTAYPVVFDERGGSETLTSQAVTIGRFPTVRQEA